MVLPRHRTRRNPTGHEYVGILEDIGADVQNVTVGDFVAGSLMAADNSREKGSHP